MLQVLSFLSLCCFLLKSIYSSGSEFALALATRGNFTFVEGSAGPDVIDYIGGVEEFELEVSEAMLYARAWRNNTLIHWSRYTAGSGGLVAKYCFDDGICWADKMSARFRERQNAFYGESAMGLVHEYCPNIPHPSSKGSFVLRLAHHFTEWIEGMTPFERVFPDGPYYSTPNAKPFRISDNLVTSLAGFVYNLSTCPIPNDIRMAHINVEMMID